MALTNDTTSGSKPSTDSGFYSGLTRTSTPTQPPKDKHSITMGDGDPAKTVNATSDGEID